MKGFAKLLTWILSLLFVLSVAMPLIWVVVSSLKPAEEIAGSPWSLPSTPKFMNYVNAWNESEIGKYFGNSLIVCLATLLFLIPISAMAAYIFAKHPFKFGNILFSGIVGGMAFPQFLVIVPLFLLMRDLQLLNSHVGLVLVYVAFSLPFTIFVLTGFFQNLPEELGEAAMLDGCSYSATFFKIMMPLARPGLVVALIFNIIGLWNEYNLALIMMSDPAKFTLPLGLAKVTNTSQYVSDWGALFASVVIVMTPVLIVYWLLKDKIQEAMLAGAIKG